MSVSKIFQTLVAGLSGLGFLSAQACDHQDADGKLDIGVVLSGGGAMSATQIGALEVIEELGIPVHCIVGTSMGGVVAGLYATGYSGSELREIFLDADWSKLIPGQVPFEERILRQKELDRLLFPDYVAGRSETGFNLPAGYNTLEGMRRFLRYRTRSVAGIEDFSQLPTPFATVGTDLSRGEGITLDRGDLVASMLATMAVPGVYPAQQIDEYVLIDGGMSKQIAVDVAREMGADRIIVLDVTIVPNEINSTPSITGTVQQLIQIMVWSNWQRQIQLLEEGDIHLQPELDGLSSGNFGALELGMERGRTVALAARERLLALKAEAAPPTRRPLQRTEPPVLAEIVVDESSGLRADLIATRSQLQPGDVATEEALDRGLAAVRSLDLFGTVDYDLRPTQGGAVLALRTTPRALGREQFQVGAQFSNTFDGFSDYELILRYAKRPMNASGGELSITGALGDDLFGEVAWHQPFGTGGRFFIDSFVNHSALSVPVQLDRTAINQNWLQTTRVGLSAGREFGFSSIAEAEIAWERADSEPIYALSLLANTQIEGGLVRDLVIEPLPGETAQYAVGGLKLATDSFNAAQFPTSGIGLSVRGDYHDALGGDTDIEGFASASFTMSAAGKMGRTGLFASIDGGTVGSQADAANVFYLGGFKRLSGVRDQAVPADSYLLGRVEAYQRLTSLRNVTGVATFIGGTLEMADLSFEDEFLDFEGSIFAGSIYGAAMTPIGPTYIAYGRSEGGRQAVYFYLGQSF
ncbi:MAG: patatin-like phospholipase family protein [Pseudomonadota bacterium]